MPAAISGNIKRIVNTINKTTTQPSFTNRFHGAGMNSAKAGFPIKSNGIKKTESNPGSICHNHSTL
jgi:hypothetical protein